MQEKLYFGNGEIVDTVFPEFTNFRGKRAFTAKVGGDIALIKALLTSPGEWKLRQKTGELISLSEYQLLEKLELETETGLITFYITAENTEDSLKKELSELREKYALLLEREQR